jgi:hypothetical protein
MNLVRLHTRLHKDEVMMIIDENTWTVMLCGEDLDAFQVIYTKREYPI